MGTPEFSVPSIDALNQSAFFDLKAIVAQPDKPVGRKKVLTPPPTKQYALEHGIEILQPSKVRNNDEFHARLREINPDIIVVAAYGKIIPQETLDIPKYGCINIHGSILPKYRGAAPIQFALLNGEKETGITTILMDAGMDTGDMLTKHYIEVNETETSKTLHDRLAHLAAQTIVEDVRGFIEGRIQQEVQDETETTYTQMIKKEDGEVIPSELTAQEIYRRWQGYTPWPGIYLSTENGNIKLPLVRVTKEISSAHMGLYTQDKKLYLGCKDNTTLEVVSIQPPGKKAMDAQSFINGYTSLLQ
jgi:methionyl-tRNA formyltransferase